MMTRLKLRKVKNLPKHLNQKRINHKSIVLVVVRTRSPKKQNPTRKRKRMTRSRSI